MENAGRNAVVWPSLTLIRMLAKVPSLVVVGVPESAPVAVLKVPQAGRLTIVKLNVEPPGLVTMGWKL